MTKFQLGWNRTIQSGSQYRMLSFFFRSVRFFNRAMKKGAPGCLGYIGDEILPSYIEYRDYNRPLQGSLLNNQYNGN